MGLNYDLWDKLKMDNFEKFPKANRIFLNARFFEHFVRILALKIEDNLI